VRVGGLDADRGTPNTELMTPNPELDMVIVK
jgi:hypothetical protein